MAPPIPLDRVSGAAMQIDFEHHEIHQEESFLAMYQSAAPLPTVAGEETAIGFTAPTLEQSGGKYIHMEVDAFANDESTFEIREGPNVTPAQGTAYAPFNRWRDSTNPSVIRDHGGPPTVANRVTTYTVAEANAADLALGAGGLLHSEVLAVGGALPFASLLNARSRGRRELVLYPGIEYVVILTNLTGNNTIHTITLNWYEHELSNYKS